MKARERHISLVKFAILITVYRLSLDFIYLNVISPIWDYQHFVTHVDHNMLLLSYLWIVGFVLFDRKLCIDRKPSSILLLFIDMMFFIPLSSFMPLAGVSFSFFIYCVLYWLLVVFFQHKLFKKEPNVKICEETRTPNDFFLFVSVIIIVFNFLLTVSYFGFHIKLDLNDIYDIRGDVKDMNLPGLVSYVKMIASPVTLVTLLVFIIRKKYNWVALLSIIQLSSFAFGAHKSDFFGLILAYCIGFLYKSKKLNIVVYAFIFFNLIALIEYFSYGYSAVSVVYHRRVLFMPPLLSNAYYEFFSTHELVFLRESFLRHLGFHSPYDLLIPQLIGNELYGTDANCNTGIIGDDFAQFGWFSLLVFPFLRYLVMRLYDSVVSIYDWRVALCLGSLYAGTFIAGSFFSGLLSGGFLIICFLLYFANKNKSVYITVFH